VSVEPSDPIPEAVRALRIEYPALVVWLRHVG
jgi:hypothetical protein